MVMSRALEGLSGARGRVSGHERDGCNHRAEVNAIGDENRQARVAGQLR
jgi:hypothetical protein